MLREKIVHLGKREENDLMFRKPRSMDARKRRLNRIFEKGSKRNEIQFREYPARTKDANEVTGERRKGGRCALGKHSSSR